MKLKKMLTLTLAALYLVMAAFPVNALGVSFNYTTTYDHDTINRTGSIVVTTASATLTRTLNPNYPSNPASDYSLGIRVRGKNLDNTTLWTAETKNTGLSCTFTHTGMSKKVLPKAQYWFYIQPDITLPLSSQTYDYTDSLSHP